LAYLCEQGGDPALFSEQGRTAKVIAERSGNRMAAVLLGMHVYCLCCILVSIQQHMYTSFVFVIDYDDDQEY